MIPIKALIFSLLNFFNLNTPTPDIMELALVSRHASLLQTLAQIIRSPKMVGSIQKICKEELPPNFIRTMQTPLPTVNDITLYIYPESIEIVEGKRACNEKKYLELKDSIHDLLDNERINPEKYESFSGNSLQLTMHKMLIDQVNRGAELDQSNFLKHDSSFKALIKFTLHMTDLSRNINTKQNGFSYVSEVAIFPSYIIYFLENITQTCDVTRSNPGYSFEQTYDHLKLLIEAGLRQIKYLNKRLDDLNAKCNRAEYHFFINDLRRTNQITEKMLACLINENKFIQL